jgi:hypothetical protein
MAVERRKILVFRMTGATQGTGQLMAQRMSLRDQAALSVEKRRSNRTVYLLSRALEDPGRICRNGGPLPPAVCGMGVYA